MLAKRADPPEKPADGRTVTPGSITGFCPFPYVISARDAYRGETVKAIVVLRSDAKGKVQERDIIAWAHEHMAAYKAPRIVEFVDALPKSGAGKVMWRLLQDKENAARAT